MTQDSVIKNPDASPTKDSGEEDKIKKDMKEKDSNMENQSCAVPDEKTDVVETETNSNSKSDASKMPENTEEIIEKGESVVENTEDIVKAVEVTPCMASKPRGKKKATAETVTAPPPSEGATSTVTKAEDVEIDPSIEGATAAEIPAAAIESQTLDDKDRKQDTSKEKSGKVLSICHNPEMKIYFYVFLK